MAILYIASESDQKQLRKRGGPDYMDELLDDLTVELKGVDARHRVLLAQALGQCRFSVDPAQAGEWAVADDTEQRWLVAVLTALSAALATRGWPWMAPPDPETWLRYFDRAPVVAVDPVAGGIDLSEYADWITGKCKCCGVQTTGLFEVDDALTARDFERYDEQIAKGEWWCDECYNNRCGDCGEQPRAPDDDECCEECRASRDAADAPLIDSAP